MVGNDFIIKADIYFIKEYLNKNNNILIKPCYNNDIDCNYIVINDELELQKMNLSNNTYIFGNIDDLTDNNDIKDLFLTGYYGLFIEKYDDNYVVSLTVNSYDYNNNNIKCNLENFPIISSKGKDIKLVLNNINSKKLSLIR